MLELIPQLSLDDVQPLAIPVEPVSGESLIGLVARAARANVLGSTSPILASFGLTLLHPGTIGLDLADAPALATVLGCATSEVESRLHPYLYTNDGLPAVRWGSSALFRQYVVVERRRISPKSLETSAHHRSDWMNLLLPFCPESLEPLIDTCSKCGSVLGWRRAWGIANCDKERCRALIESGTQDPLPTNLVDGYRAFARLVSAEAGVHGAAVAALAEPLRKLRPELLLNLLLHLGGTWCEPRVTVHRGTVQRLPPVKLAQIVSRGVDLLSEWPLRLRSTLANEVARLEQVGRQREQPLLTAVRRLGLRHTASPEQIKVVREALPEIFTYAGTALASLVGPVVNGAEGCKIAGISASRLKALREANTLAFSAAVSTGRRLQTRYDPRELANFGERLKRSVPASRLEQIMAIPRYAVEQLACLGQIDWEDHPAVQHFYASLCLSRAGVDEIVRQLRNGAHSTAMPVDAIKLSTAMRMVGGRMKPWGEVITAMRNRQLPYWLGSGRGQVRSTYVRREDLLPFASAHFSEDDFPAFPFADQISQIDACEILNIDSPRMKIVIDAGALKFRPDGVALLASKAGVLMVAQDVIAPAEAALRLNTASNTVAKRIAKNSEVERLLVGWRRSQFDAVFGVPF